MHAREEEQDLSVTVKPHSTIRIGYMCRADYEHHLEHDPDGCLIFKSIADLLKGRPCAYKCGVVEVEVRLVRIVQGEIPKETLQ